MCLSTAALLWHHIIEKDQQILAEIKSSAAPGRKLTHHWKQRDCEQRHSA